MIAELLQRADQVHATPAPTFAAIESEKLGQSSAEGNRIAGTRSRNGSVVMAYMIDTAALNDDVNAPSRRQAIQGGHRT